VGGRILAYFRKGNHIWQIPSFLGSAASVGCIESNCAAKSPTAREKAAQFQWDAHEVYQQQRLPIIKLNPLNYRRGATAQGNFDRLSSTSPVDEL